MHKSLERQIIRFYGSLQNVPEDQKKFLEQEVNKAYVEKDKEYNLIERSLDISSKELTEANKLLRLENEEIEKRVKERTEELLQEKSKLNRIAQNMETGAILMNKEGRVTFFNNKAKEIVNLKDTDKESEVLESLANKFKNYPIKEYLNRCVAGETLRIPEAETENFIFEILFQSLLLDEDSKSLSFGHLVWIRDITEEKLLERSKSELVAIASHQLRTPLSVTKGNTEMLLDESLGKLNKEQKEIVEQTAQSNEQLISLVNDMLDITRMESGKPFFNLEKISVKAVLDKVLSDLSLYAKKDGVSINFKTTEEIPKVLADNDKLYQVFQNLIENAIKYCHNDGSVPCLVNISVKSYTDKIRIEISDNGIGISKHEQKRIFEMFYRASNAVKLISNGTGLGLYIVKSIVEHLGGTIWFESEENKNTTFYVELPLAK